jgi:hypothetical protein
MSATQVLQRYGTWALIRFMVALLVFVTLHLARLPLLAVARVLQWGMTHTDRLLMAAPTHTPWKEAP